jgi:hypothetical protein
LNQRDKVSTQGKVSYSDISERNIFDTRFTGCGKTTSALQYIAEVVNQNRPVIVLMQSYERLENNYLESLDDSTKARTIVFKGKTQDGMCTHSSRYKKLWEEQKRPKNECEKCPDSKKCMYQKRLTELSVFSKSKEGFCILTTEKNFNKIYSEIKDLNPVVIIDDISLSSVVMPESKITSYDLESLIGHLHEQGSRVRHLYDLALMLHSFSEDKEIEIISYITINEIQLLRELQQFLTDNTGRAELPSHRALPFVYHLISAIKSEGKLYFYFEYHRLKVVVDESPKFKPLRVCYLNATPSRIDEYCIKQLGEYEYKHLKARAQETKKYLIFQISDSANARSAVFNSKRLPDDFLTLISVIKKPLSFVKQKLLLFSFKELFEKWTTDGVLLGIDYTPEIYFGSGTRGTNDYKDFPISFVIGNPNLPADYFLHPAFEPVWKPNDVFEEEKKKDPYNYRVDWNISEPEARVNLVQMIGRNLRDSPTNPDAKKIVVVFSDIEIKEDCKKQNGSTVIQIKIRPEIPVIQGKKKGKTPFFDAYKSASQQALKPQIKSYIENHIDELLDENPDVPLQLQIIAQEIQKRIEIYDNEGIKKIIKAMYDTESRHVENKGRKTNTAFIIKKKQE